MTITRNFVTKMNLSRQMVASNYYSHQSSIFISRLTTIRPSSPQGTETAETIAKKVTDNNEVSDATLSAETKDAVSIESLIKHPLQNSWTLWYYDNEKGKSWESCQHQITSVDTVEDFWSLYNHIKLASEIKHGNDYSLFKNNIRPMWEDDQNKNGGRWIISLPRFYRELDSLWLDAILCLIGEAFDYSEDICGAVVNIRPRGHKIGK